jgi:outer membrane protein assembly factor BamB
MSMRSLVAGLALACAATGLVACTEAAGAPRAPAAPAAPAEVLSLRTADGPVTVDVRTGRVLADAAGAVPEADWSALFQTEPDGSGTVLRTLDPVTGAEASSVRLRGSLAIRAVSADGSRVALSPPPPAGTEAWTPVPRRRTTIVVADPSGGADPETYRLDGNLEPEAFSNDGEYLFVIQYLPPEAPTLYRVSEIDLEDGDVYPVLGRDKSWSQRMPGTRLEQVPAPDGTKLYTLYSSQPSAYAKGYDPAQAAADRPVAFVHVLNLAENWAFCLPLPKRLWDAPAGEQAMAASADGSRLYVVDPSRDTVAVVDAKKTKVLRAATVDFATDGAAHAAAAVSPDGATLYVGTGEGVVALDATTLTVRFRWPTSAPVEALATSGDGAAVYAAFADHIDVLDPSTGAVQRSIPVAGALAIEHVAPAA